MKMMMKQVEFYKDMFFLIYRTIYSGSSNILDKIRSIVTYVCTYLWAISFILLIFILYASIRGPFNIINSFNTGKIPLSNYLFLGLI
jgi:hypothetical protein